METYMKKQAYAFHMQEYKVQQPVLKPLERCLVLSKPSGYDLERYFPKEWRYLSSKDAQSAVPKVCPDSLLIATSQRNAECRQLRFVQNYFRQSAQSQEESAEEYVYDLRKHLSISTLSNLLFSNFQIYVVKCGVMDTFAKGKKNQMALENWLVSNGLQLKLEVHEATEKFLSPYESDYIGFILIPRLPLYNQISLSILREEFRHLNQYHQRNVIFSTKFL